MEEYCLIITYKCNWNCPYCIVDTHNQKEISFDDNIKQINLVKDNSITSLTGGEPGLLPSDELLYIIKKLKSKNCFIKVSTNGEIFKRHPMSTLKLIDSFWYHCSDSLDLNDKIYINNELNIGYILIIHDNNMCNLKEFLIKHKNIKFTLVGADKSNKDCSPILSKKNAIEIIKEYNNIIKNSISLLLQKVK